MGGITKNRSHLAALKRVFNIVVVIGVVEGRVRDDGVVLREVVLWGGGQ